MSDCVCCGGGGEIEECYECECCGQGAVRFTPCDNCGGPGWVDSEEVSEDEL